MVDRHLQRFVDAELWTLREAAYLLHDCLPPADDSGFMAVVKSGSDLGWTYKGLKDSTRTGTLKYIRADARDTLWNRLVRPADAVAWATGRGIVVPHGLQSILAATASDASAEKDGAAARLKQRQQKVTVLRDDAVIEALRTRGIDPMKVPAPPAGNKPWPLRVAIMKELNLSPVMAKESFTRLRKEGRMRPASPKGQPSS